MTNFYNFRTSYISIAPDRAISMLPSMTDEKYRNLADKNGIYKVVELEILSNGAYTTSADNFNDILDQESKKWNADRRNTWLWLFKDLSDGSVHLRMNMMGYIGLKDPNIKIDTNCPYPKSCLLLELAPAGTDVTAEIVTLKDTSGAELSYGVKIPKVITDVYPSFAIDSDGIYFDGVTNGYIPDLFKSMPVALSASTVGVRKNVDNTLYPRLPWIGAPQLLNEDSFTAETGTYDSYRSYCEETFGANINKSGFTYHQASQSNESDFLSSITNSNYIICGVTTQEDAFGIITRVKGLYTTGSPRPRNKNLLRVGSDKDLSKYNTSNNEPKLRLISGTQGSLKYLDLDQKVSFIKDPASEKYYIEALTIILLLRPFNGGIGLNTAILGHNRKIYALRSGGVIGELWEGSFDQSHPSDIVVKDKNYSGLPVYRDLNPEVYINKGIIQGTEVNSDITWTKIPPLAYAGVDTPKALYVWKD